MNILSFISTLALMMNLYLGLHIFFLDRKSKINRIFFFLCFIQILWASGGIVMYPAEEKETVLLIFQVGWFIVIPYMAIVLHFCLEITRLIKLKSWHYIILYTPVLILLYGSQTSFLLYKDVLKVNNYWVFVLAADSAWSYLYIAYYHLYIIGSITLLFIWNRKSLTVKDRKQSLFLLITLISGLLLSLIEGIIVPVFTPYRTPALAPIYAMIWMIGIWYAIVKYRFLTITPALVSKDIIANIDESIILTDNELRVLTVNSVAQQLLEYPAERIKFCNLSDIILENELIQKEILNMSGTNHKSFSSRIHFIKNDNSQILIDAKFKKIYDKFGDPLGILIIGRVVRELQQFKSTYKVTGKQSEIIQYILQGKSNKEIAMLAGVAERTIKGHITAIYHKLRISNKMELFNLLKDFNLIPEQPAEKSIYVL